MALALLATLVLSACGTSQPRPDRTPPPSSSASTDSLAEEANQRFNAGRYAAAAELYEQAARSSSGTRRQALLIRSAEAARLGDRRDLASRAVSGLDDNQLTPQLRPRADLLRAETGQFRNNPQEVLRRLPPPEHGTEPQFAERVWRQRAKAHRDAGNAAEMVKALVQREAWLSEPEALKQNRRFIWRSLQTSPNLGDDFLYRLDLDPVSRGWLELAVLDRAVWASQRDRNSALDDWQSRYSTHPGTEFALTEVGSRPLNRNPVTGNRNQGQASLPPEAIAPEAASGDSIALLLPLSGPYANPGRAVRDGFLAAHMARQDPPRLIVLDVAAAGQTPVSAYEQARRYGAGSIIGPLEKTDVMALARASQGEVPILALNYVDDTVPAPPGFHQFGLAPEDEAREVARRMIEDGIYSAALLAPAEDWASRSLRAFETQYQTLGGTIASYRSYDPQAAEYSSVVQELVNESGYVKRTPGSEAAEPEIGVFMLAKPQQARLIRPMFLYHAGGALPIYATSHIYSGKPDPVRDADLEGIRFVDTDWSLNRSPEITQVKEQVRQLYPRTFDQYSRLYAFGFDAARLQPYVAGNRLDTGRYYSAASGVLFMNDANRIGRRLSWAEFRNGKPRVIDYGQAGQ